MYNIIKAKIDEWNSGQIIPLLVVVAYLLPYYLLGENAHILIHDNLDSVFVWYQNLINSGKLLSDNSAIIEQFMGGVPRSSLPGELDVFTWLFVLFTPYTAYTINRTLMTLIAFYGMSRLLENHFIGDDKMVKNGVALCFALLPFWPFGGLSVAGIPIVLNSFLNIRSNKGKWYDWLWLVIFPFIRA